MKALLLVACVVAFAPSAFAQAASITGEAAVTGGVSTDELSAAATQLRAFGAVKGGIRFFGEAAWAARSAEENDGEPDGDEGESDAFNAAYPYGNRVEIIEAFGERLFRPANGIIGIRAGRFRTPFGISSGSDHAYNGFLRAPLIRYGEYFALSNTFLEHGADVVAGLPHLTVEAAVGAPADVGETIRRSGTDSIVRVQGYAGPLIVGASHMRTSAAESWSSSPSRAHFTGFDVRWMAGGVQLRGEWITGAPFDGASTTGWYADVFVHRPGMGPVTAIARVERLGYDAHEGGTEYSNRETFGARVRLLDALSLSVNVLHHEGPEDEAYRANALDVALTWSVRSR